MAKKFCLLYFPFVPSQSGQEGGGGGGKGGRGGEGGMLIIARGPGPLVTAL